MTDETKRAELTAAAERVTRAKAGEELYEIYGTDYGDTMLEYLLASDKEALADAYLATVAADDGDYINSDWLKSLGFIEYVPLRFHLNSALNLECDCGAWVLMASYHRCGQLETRGQLRQLCLALNIALQPSGQETQS